MANAKFVRYEELTSFGVPKYSRKHLIDMQRRGQFPKARQITANRIAWLESELAEWVESRPVGKTFRDEGPPDEPQ